MTEILTRFRLGKYAVTTDIEKAFLQIGLDESDRDAIRFFWLSNPSDATSPLTTYRFKSVLFGATCSPFILNATLLKHFEENPSKTSSRIAQDLYVDNVLTSFDDESSALQFYRESRSLLQKGGFNLRSWNSNSAKLRELAYRENTLDLNGTVKILGMRWNVDEDKLLFPEVQVNLNMKDVTKREILRQSSKIFDPLGLLNPVTVKAKILMQSLWKQNFGWDECLPFDIKDQWNNLAEELADATSLEFHRYLYKSETSNNLKSLHIFTDASKQAYGACA